MSSIRAFIAVNLPLAVLNRVAQLQSELRERAKRAGLKVGWVPPPNMHVTLKFLGQIPTESATAVADLLSARLAEREALLVRVQGVGAFPSREAPRVLWVGLIHPSNGVEELARDVDAWMADLGFAPESRPFHPHLTLGRVKQGRADLLQELEEVDLGECTFTEVVLYKSVLQRQGAEYTALHRVPLRR